MIKVEFHFDFGSPNAYLSHLVIPEIEKRTGVKFEYVPVLLGGVFKMTNNRSPAESLAGIKNKPDYERLETARFIRRHGIKRFASNPFFPVNTLVLMRGAVAAQSLGIFERYVDEVYRHMWAEPKKMDDPAILRAAFSESRLPTDKILELAQTQNVKDRLLENTQRSVERGTFGSPTFFVGDEIFFGKDRLRDVRRVDNRLQVIAELAPARAPTTRRRCLYRKDPGPPTEDLASNTTSCSAEPAPQASRGFQIAIRSLILQHDSSRSFGSDKRFSLDLTEVLIGPGIALDPDREPLEKAFAVSFARSPSPQT